MDDEGKRWYPPSGNGILAASQGVYPKKGAVTSGDVTTNPEEGIKVSAPDEGEKIVDVAPTPAANGDSKKDTTSDIAASESITMP